MGSVPMKCFLCESEKQITLLKVVVCKCLVVRKVVSPYLITMLSESLIDIC